MASPGGGGLHYTPEPHERQYYDGLFQAADPTRNGAIGGQEAVAFFSRSKLPMEQLKNVWTVADNPPSNTLNRPKFAVAIRLIQLLQNGVKGQGSSLAVPPGTQLRPVYLEGVSGTVVPLPGPQQQQQQQQQASSQGMPPQQQQQQQAQAASQQQQQPPPPAAQQQQQPQMNNGGVPPVDPKPPGDGNMALTVQDPYTLVPNERARYESLFPQYAKEDGFMHGREAVQLFSKSGLDQNQLRDIWNMVDQPVDNKLDKLEFAIAMHLIVCISKKNLPMPKILPFSLKTLKQQQQQTNEQVHSGISPGPSPAFDSQQHQPPMTIPEPTIDPVGIPAGSNAMAPSTAMSPRSMQGPPPLTNPGGVGISDAFEGLSTASSGMDRMGGLPPPSNGFGPLGGGGSTAETSYGGYEANSSSFDPSPKIEPAQPPSVPSPPRAQEVPDPRATLIPEPRPKTSEVLAKSYNMSDSTVELEKLKTVLQKLQAENIALKAQLGTMSEEEKDLQREINATVAEIGELSNHLTTLRAEVLASKSRLMEATAELKAATEKRSVIKDLIRETEATKEAIDTAYQGIEASVNAAQAPAPPPPPAPAFEGDLFGFSPAPVPQPQASVYETDPEPTQHFVAAPSPFPAPFLQGESGGPQLETVSDSSDDEQDNELGGQGDKPEELFSYNQPPANTYQSGPPGGQNVSNLQENPYAFDTNNAFQGMSNAHQGISYEQNFRPNQPTHNKQSSISSNLSFEVMGGAPIPQSQFSQQHQDENESNDDEEIAIATSMEEINELKKKARDAEEIARDSEGTLRQLMARADKLRRAADQAEVEARQKTAEATEKKSGFMSGGKKKKSMKEATQAKNNAEAKKKEFLAAQSQANDAQAVAMETKREAEKLRKLAEQAELDAAAAASMQQKQPEPSAAPPQQPSKSFPPQHQGPGGHGQPQAYGQQQAYGQPQAYGYPPPGPSHSQAPYGAGGGYGQTIPTQQPNYGQFNPSVMGQPQGGGIDIPSPAGGGDPYANPF